MNLPKDILIRLERRWAAQMSQKMRALPASKERDAARSKIASQGLRAEAGSVDQAQGKPAPR